MHLDYVLLFESGGAFSVVQRVHTSSKRNPLQELVYKHMYVYYIYICICVNKHSVAYQDVDIEHGVLASVMRAKWRCSIHSHDTKRPHIDVCRGFSFLGLPFL